MPWHELYDDKEYQSLGEAWKDETIDGKCLLLMILVSAVIFILYGLGSLVFIIYTK